MVVVCGRTPMSAVPGVPACECVCEWCQRSDHLTPRTSQARSLSDCCLAHPPHTSDTQTHTIPSLGPLFLSSHTPRRPGSRVPGLPESQEFTIANHPTKQNGAQPRMQTVPFFCVCSACPLCNLVGRLLWQAIPGLPSLPGFQKVRKPVRTTETWNSISLLPSDDIVHRQFHKKVLARLCSQHRPSLFFPERCGSMEKTMLGGTS